MQIYLQIAKTPLHGQISLRVPSLRFRTGKNPNHAIFCEFFPKPNVFVKSLMQPILSLFHFWQETKRQKFLKIKVKIFQFPLGDDKLFTYKLSLSCCALCSRGFYWHHRGWKKKIEKKKKSCCVKKVVPEQLKLSLNKVLFICSSSQHNTIWYTGCPNKFCTRISKKKQENEKFVKVCLHSG